MASSIFYKLKRSPIFSFESLIIVAALLFAFFGWYLEKQNEQELKDKLRIKYRTIPVVAVSKQLKKGQKIKKEDLKRVWILQNLYTKNMIVPKNYKSVIGKEVALDLLPGDLMLFSMLESILLDDSISHKIPIGRRLFTLTVKKSKGPTHKLSPGDHVDILMEYELEEEGGSEEDKDQFIFTFFEDIIIRAVGKNIDTAKSYEAKNISFFVTPSEMERLTFAQNHGKFFISLRNPFDFSKRSYKERKGFNSKSFLLSKGVYESLNPPVYIEYMDRRD